MHLMKEVDTKDIEKERLATKVAHLEKQVAMMQEKQEKSKMMAQGASAMSLMFPFMQGGQTQFVSMGQIASGKPP